MNKIDYNPDILTCLASLSNDEVFTPPKIVNEMLDLLPAKLWTDKTAKFLDPVSKSGVFLREIAKRLNKGLEKQIPDKQKRINHILNNQLYGIAITELTSLLSRRSLYCSKTANGRFTVCTEFKNKEGNIKFNNIKHDWVNGRCEYCGASQEVYDRGDALESHAYEFIHIQNPGEVFKMKFDVIIGNPPYQLSDEGYSRSASPIYHKFIQQAKKLNPRFLTMIIPARWYSGGKGLDDFREEMLQDNRIREVHDFPDATDVFPGVQIKGGICYFLWDRDNKGLCKIASHSRGAISSAMERPLLDFGADTFIRFNEAIPIVNKVRKFKEPSIKDIVSMSKPFGLRTNFLGKEKPFQNCIKLFQNGGIGYISKDEIESGHEAISKYKVFIPPLGSGSDSFPHPILGKPFLGEPNTACTETYIYIGLFENCREPENLISYIKTKFFRFLVLLNKPAQHATKRVYYFVPLQDFSKSWTDKELYKKYKLSKEEIDFIESMIRPMTSETQEEEIPDESED